MQIFLSWSGARSRALATVLREWLPDVLHYAKPWLSAEDITAGQRWLTEVSRLLDASDFGILCITQENAAAPWLNFEAGALSKALADGTLVPYLLDVQLGDIISGPLSQFQAQKVDREGTYALVCAINGRHEQPIESGRLRRLFDRCWPDLEQALNDIRGSHPVAARSSRDEADLLEEIVSQLSSIGLRLSAIERRVMPVPSDEVLAQLAKHVPVEQLREHAQMAVRERSLRYTARHIDLTPMGLRAFVMGTGTPSARTLRLVRAWYAREVLLKGGPRPFDRGADGPPPNDTPDEDAG